VKSGSIGLYPQRNNLRFVVLGCFPECVIRGWGIEVTSGKLGG